MGVILILAPGEPVIDQLVKVDFDLQYGPPHMSRRHARSQQCFSKVFKSAVRHGSGCQV
jgi:hypothetical protein